MQKATLALAALLLACPAFADTVRIHGAPTVLDLVVTPNREPVEKSTGHTLEIVGSSTGKGLASLADGEADLAMVSEPLDIAVAAAAAAGRTLDASKLQAHEIRKAEIVFVVHASNPVSSLTWEQLRDIHTGKIRNWRDVGGKDQPIAVYADSLTGGTRAMVRKVVLGGSEYGSNVHSLSAPKRVAESVARDPAGVGGVGDNVVTPDGKVVQTKKIERPLAFVTLGPPSAKTKQVIEAFRAETR